jgi:hypothetical protein
MQPFSRQKEELEHPYIGRQPIRMQRVGIGEIGIAAEQAVDDGRNEALLQQVFGLAPASAVKIVRLIPGGGTGVGALMMIGLASERQPDHRLLRLADDLLRDIIRSVNCGIQFREQCRRHGGL